MPSSDDVLIDLRIEESLSREVLMSIDSSNRKEDCWTFGFFLAILICCFLLGLFGPPLVQHQTNTKRFEDSTTKFVFALDEISPQNHFIDCDVSFIRSNAGLASDEVLDNLEFRTLKYKDGTGVELRTISLGAVSVVFPAQSAYSRRIHVFADRMLFYDKIAVKVPNVGYGVVVKWTYGDPRQAFVQTGFRSLFSLACIFALLFLVCRLRKIPFKIWHLEQRLTVFLLVFAILADDPLYFIQWLEATRVGIIYDVVSDSLFKVYLLFFMLALFDSLRYKNRKIDSCFFAPKYMFFVVMLVADLLHRLYEHSQTYAFTQLASPWTKSLVDTIQWSLQILSILWLIFAIWQASVMIDITEKYKFTVYAITCLSSFLIVTFFELISQLKLLRHTSLSFVMVFSVQNCFVLIMTTFHWPFELLSDRQYQGTDSGIPEFLLTDD